MKRLMLCGLALILATMMILAGPNMVSAKTLTIGAVTFLGWPLGINFQKFLESYVPAFNEETGGLSIGGEKYKIKIILYDSKMSPEAGRAAVERLVYKDKVKFILGDETVEAWMPVTEKNKVLVVAATPSPKIFDPKWKYTFQGSTVSLLGVGMWGWLTDNRPDIKSFMGVFPDAIHGRNEERFASIAGKNFGLKQIKSIFYKPGTTDFSAIATKVKRSNPDMFTLAAGGPLQDSLLMKAVHDAGYKGQVFSQIGLSVMDIAKVIPLDKVEGMICSIDGTHLESIPSPHGRLFKKAYIAKYGKWDEPEGPHIFTYRVLISGIEQAQSLDVDKIAAVMSSGMKFEGLGGPAKMVARPDLGVNRTVDTLYQVYVKRIEKGKAKHIDTISIEESYEFCKKFFGW